VNKIKKFLIKFFGLRGSWSWAVRQMKKGHIVYPKYVTGCVKYRFSIDGQDRIQWSFQRDETRVLLTESVWENANIFYSDFDYTEWGIFI
jgi:protein involved in temperature-dependent protein secretion